MKQKPDWLLIAGAVATCDRQDEIPRAIAEAGGEILRVGMPVDPGNLLCLARLGKTHIVILPGCAKSPKINGLDWVLARLAAGESVASEDIAQMGVGGLLADIPERPGKRIADDGENKNENKLKPSAVILAAGASSRMGENKLLKQWRGKPLLAHAAATAAAAKQTGLIENIVAVTGRDCEQTKKLLAGFADIVAHNPDYQNGMASSLQCALDALPENCPAVLVVLGDMPKVQTSDIAAVVGVWQECRGECDIVVPAHRGKRGNPVLLSARQFAAAHSLAGDTGARALFAGADLREADASAGVLFDIDSPEELSQQ